MCTGPVCSSEWLLESGLFSDDAGYIATHSIEVVQGLNPNSKAAKASLQSRPDTRVLGGSYSSRDVSS